MDSSVLPPLKEEGEIETDGDSKSQPDEHNQDGSSLRETIEAGVGNASETMIHTFLGVLIAMCILGTCTGACCIGCCMRCCRRRQRLREEEASKLQKYTADDTVAGIDQGNAIAYIADPSPIPPQEVARTGAAERQDTEDHEAEHGDKVGALGESTLGVSVEEENFASAMSSLGINFEPPLGRRNTYQKALNPGNPGIQKTNSLRTLDLFKKAPPR